MAVRQPKTIFSAGHPRFTHNGYGTPRKVTDEIEWQEVYSLYGPMAPAHVTGDFAVALELPGGAIFLAVDHFAIQTLCFKLEAGKIQYAKHAQHLAYGGTDLDLQALFNYLFFHVIPSPCTIYKNVFRLPPAHYALFEDGKLTVAPYWTPTFQENCTQTFSATARRIAHYSTGLGARATGKQQSGVFS